MLTEAGSQNQTCEIAYLDGQGREMLVISRVHDLYAENGMDYVRLDEGSVPLDRITGVNGRRGSGETDETLLQKGLQPDAAPATDNHRYPEEEGHRHTNAVIITHPDPADEPVPHTHAPQTSDDFVHRFLSSPPPFMIADNDLFSFTADRLHHRLYMRVKKPWSQVREVQELHNHIGRIAGLIGPEFTLLNDLSEIEPDDSGTVWAPPVPNRDALLRNGLLKVADLVAPECETLVHGMDSFSVNSVPIRYFKDRISAEHWLTSEREDTDSISLNDHP